MKVLKYTRNSPHVLVRATIHWVDGDPAEAFAHDFRICMYCTRGAKTACGRTVGGYEGGWFPLAVGWDRDQILNCKTCIRVLKST